MGGDTQFDLLMSPHGVSKDPLPQHLRNQAGYRDDAIRLNAPRRFWDIKIKQGTYYGKPFYGNRKIDWGKAKVVGVLR